MSEFDSEPVPGLPENLPAGEHILWQGKPEAWGVVRHLMFAPYVAAYFATLSAWTCLATISAGEGAREASVAALWLLGLGSTALAILGAVAWAVQRTTVYTITNRRVVLRYGLALPMAVNIPFTEIEAAAVCSYTGGTGSISLRMLRSQGLAYVFMWPHVRPWRVWAPQPMLACVPDISTVSARLGQALVAASAGVVAHRPLPPSVAQEWRPHGALASNGGLGARS